MLLTYAIVGQHTHQGLGGVLPADVAASRNVPWNGFQFLATPADVHVVSKACGQSETQAPGSMITGPQATMTGTFIWLTREKVCNSHHTNRHFENSSILPRAKQLPTT